MKNEIISNDFNEVLNLVNIYKQKAYKEINKVLIELYWNIGEYISTKTQKDNWGKGIVEELANYISRKEPNIKGFTARNLWRMKQFFETYKDNKKLSPLVSEVSWTNNLMILSSSKSDKEREFYLYLTIKERYSKRELQRQIKSGLFERTMLSSGNLSDTIKQLPQNTRDIFRDVYSLEFLGLPQTHNEKSLQQSLIANLKSFILEIGKDFCFVGEEYKVQVGNKDFSIDLLFFHRELQSLVAFELKIDEFEPSYLGQLEFYLEALDKDIRKSHENPSIGVLLCRQKDDEVVKYALSRSVSPAIISQYETKLIPKYILKQKLNEFYTLLESSDE